MNVLILSGNLGKDPEVKTFGENKVAKFPLAVKGYKDSTMWVNVEVWGKSADFVENYIKKGQNVTVKGELKIDEYEGKYYTSAKCFEIEAVKQAETSDLPF